MADTCPSCETAIAPKEANVKCGECGHKFHFGKCAGLTEKSYKGKKEAAKKAWRCQTCRAEQGSGSGEDSNSDADIKVILASIKQSLQCLPALKTTVDKVEKAIGFMSDKFDEFEKKIDRQDKEIKALKTRVAGLEQVDDNNDVVQMQIQQELRELEFRSRRQNLEVHGIAVVPDEDLIDTLNTVADKLEVPHITSCDVVSVHRLPSKGNYTPGIIARFARQATRDTWLANKSKLNGTAPRVYIQENMTRHDRELLRSVKDAAKDKGYRYVWHVNGKIMVRKTDGAKAIHVKSTEEFDRL